MANGVAVAPVHMGPVLSLARPLKKETCMRAAYPLQANGATETFDSGLVRKQKGMGDGG